MFRRILPWVFIICAVMLALPLVQKNRNLIGRAGGVPANEGVAAMYSDDNEEEEQLILIGQRQLREYSNLGDADSRVTPVFTPNIELAVAPIISPTVLLPSPTVVPTTTYTRVPTTTRTMRPTSTASPSPTRTSTPTRTATRSPTSAPKITHTPTPRVTAAIKRSPTPRNSPSPTSKVMATSTARPLATAKRIVNLFNPKDNFLKVRL